MKTIEWQSGKVRLIDQTRLPAEEVYLQIEDYRDMASAIREMRVRGAPAIGVAAAYGMALAALQAQAGDRTGFLEEMEHAAETLAATRPTAVNLFWALERMKRVARQEADLAVLKQNMVAEAQHIAEEDVAANRRIGDLGADLIEDGFTVLTHCNAGALATVAYGTALAPIRRAREQGKKVQVFAAETRPLLQGARLTAWELMRYGIPVTLITDTMVGHFLSRGAIHCVMVGADRIAANGDVANKIGTYGIAVLATENGIPFYVAAPTSTIDLSKASGGKIPIEERRPEEVTHIGGVRIAPEGVAVANPAFDITPHQYVTAIITEKGIIREPYKERLKKALRTIG